MDPVSAFVFAILYMMLNGAVLGFMQRDLPDALQTSATSWRVSTLMVAAGCALLAAQAYLPLVLAVGLGNLLTSLALTGYWRAVRQFYGHPDTWTMLLPSLLGTSGLTLFAAVAPEWLAPRVVLGSASWILTAGLSAWTLRTPAKNDTSLSRRVLQGIFALLAVFMTIRLVFFVFSAPRVSTIIQPSSVMNVITPMVAAVLPVVGTTSFLLMCSERLRRQWEHAASTDHLTGLANRRTLATVGGQRLALARSGKKSFAVAVIDVDHFKSVNDKHGHDVGDLALQHVAKMLQAACRESDLPARQGGEEFVVVFDGVAQGDARSMGERIREAVERQPFTAKGLELRITVSIGVATLAEADASLDDMLHRADEALYAAKRNGRNRVELAS